MDWPAVFKMLIVCMVSIGVEAASYTKSGRVWFEQLRQPPYSLSLRAWYFVGAIYYLLFGFIAYRLFENTSGVYSIPIVLLILIMLINGLGNFIIFKYRSIKWFYLVVYPFAALLIAFIVFLLTVDKISAALASVYLLWLAYDLYYGYHLWKLNDRKPGF